MTKQQLEILRLRLINSFTRAKVEHPTEVADIAMSNVSLLLTQIEGEAMKQEAA